MTSSCGALQAAISAISGSMFVGAFRGNIRAVSASTIEETKNDKADAKRQIAATRVDYFRPQLGPMKDGFSVVPSAASQPPLNEVAAKVYEKDHLSAIGEAQRKAQRFAAATATSDQSEPADLARIVSAWPRLRDDVKATILELIET